MADYTVKRDRKPRTNTKHAARAKVLDKCAKGTLKSVEVVSKTGSRTLKVFVVKPSDFPVEIRPVTGLVGVILAWSKGAGSVPMHRTIALDDKGSVGVYPRKG